MPDPNVKIGKVKIPKPALYMGVAGAAAIILYAYYQRRAGGGGGGNTPTDGGADPSIDPSTGLPYADEFGGGYSGMGIYDPSTGGTIGTGYGQIIQQVSTNAAWTQAAVAYMTTVGYEGTAVQNAIGKALLGQALTQAELDIFNAARAVEGEPPNGYPPIHMVGNAPGGTTNPPGKSLPPPGNVHVLHTYRTEIQVGWTAVKGAKGYAVFRAEDPPGGSTPTGQRQGTVVYPSYQFKGLKPGTRYRFDIHAVGNDNQLGARGRVYAYTKK